MAHPIVFKPKVVDPSMELMKRLEAAPKEHAEALLVAWDLLQTTHDQGILDLAQGLVGGKDKIATTLAEGANTPEVIAAMRNGIALGKVLGSLDPEMLQRLAKGLEEGAKKNAGRDAEEVPSLWQLFKRVVSKDGRRGLGYAAGMLTALGRAVKE